MEDIMESEVNFKHYTMCYPEQTLHVAHLQATPQNAKIPELEETQPATDSQVAKSLTGSPGEELSHAPTSPTSSLPSSASKAQDEVL